MRIFTILILLLAGQSSFCQSFLIDYKAFAQNQILLNKTLDSLRRSPSNKELKLTRKKIKTTKSQALTDLNEQIKVLDSVFQKFKDKNGVDFDTVDSLLLIFQTSIETNLSTYIIISGKDSISFGEKWKQINLHHYKKIITDDRFINNRSYPDLLEIDDRDSLLILATKKDFVTAKKLAEEHPVLDGNNTTIYSAKKTNTHYKFEYCWLPPFGFLPIVRKK